MKTKGLKKSSKRKNPFKNLDALLSEWGFVSHNEITDRLLIYYEMTFRNDL